MLVARARDEFLRDDTPLIPKRLAIGHDEKLRVINAFTDRTRIHVGILGRGPQVHLIELRRDDDGWAIAQVERGAYQ
jgi:hypothetical protein